VVTVMPELQAGRPRNHSIPSFFLLSTLVLGHAAFSTGTIDSYAEVNKSRRETDRLTRGRGEISVHIPRRPEAK
jgi:hypothetical protein